MKKQRKHYFVIYGTKLAKTLHQTIFQTLEKTIESSKSLIWL